MAKHQKPNLKMGKKLLIAISSIKDICMINCYMKRWLNITNY